MSQSQRELATVHRILAFALLLPFLMWGVKVAAQSISCGTVATLVINSIASTDSTPRQGVPYQGAAQATGGTPCPGNTYTWALASGSLPPGLGPINPSTGTIPGTPTAPTNPYNFVLRVTDCGVGTQQQIVTRAFSMTVAIVNSISVTPASPTIGQQGQQQFTAQANWSDSRTTTITTLATWASSSTSVATINPSTGLATAGISNGTTNITATLNSVVSPNDVLTVTGGTQPVLVIQQTTVPTGYQGIAYPTFTFTATCSGCTAPYTWSVSVGTPPGGLTLNTSSTGLMTTYSGTPALNATTQTFTVKIQDSAAHSGTQSITHTIATPTSIAVTLSMNSINVAGSSQASCTVTFNDAQTKPCPAGTGGISAPNVWNSINDTSNLETSRAVTVAVPSGQVAIAIACEGSNNSDTFTFTSTPAATWPAPTYRDAGTGRKCGTSVLPNAPALTQVVAGFTTPLGVAFDEIHLVTFPGAATASVLDPATIATNFLAPGSTVQSDLSGSLTTLNASDAILYFTRWGNDQTSWTPGTGFTIPNNSQVGAGNFGANARAVVSYELVNTVQTSLTTTMAGNAGTGSYMNFMMGLKSAASTTGTTWDTTSCANGAGNTVASVNAISGAAMGLQGGTCNIRATFNGVNGTAQLTVNSPQLTGLTISPPNTTVFGAGSTQSYTATGVPDGVDYSLSVNWASDNTNVVTMGGQNNRVATCTGSPFGGAHIQATLSQPSGPVSGSTPVTCSAITGNNNLLGGCTVNTGNQLQNCTNGGLPGGWTLVAAQGFDAGPLPANQCVANCFVSPGIDSVNPHNAPGSGSNSVHGFIGSDQATSQWVYLAGNLGTYADVYLSYWEFLDSQARINDEMFLGEFDTHDANGNCVVDTNFDQFAFSSNSFSAPVLLQNQNCPGGQPNEANYGQTVSRHQGSWEQIEIWYHPNSRSGNCNGFPGQCDGFARVYQNGNLIIDVENHNIQGSLDPSNAEVRAGGLYGAYVWRGDNLQPQPPHPNCSDPCSPAPFIGSGVPCGSMGQFSSNTCGVSIPSFNWYIDDVILMKK